LDVGRMAIAAAGDDAKVRALVHGQSPLRVLLPTGLVVAAGVAPSSPA